MHRSFCYQRVLQLAVSVESLSNIACAATWLLFQMHTGGLQRNTWGVKAPSWARRASTTLKHPVADSDTRVSVKVSSVDAC